MLNAPLNGQSVAAMMRRGLSSVEAHLILPGNGFGRLRGDEPVRR